MVFRLGDAEHALPGVRLWEELGLAAELLEFKPVDYGWELRLPRPSVHRMEYLFDIPEAGLRTDPTNPRVVGGALVEGRRGGMTREIIVARRVVAGAFGRVDGDDHVVASCQLKGK